MSAPEYVYWGALTLADATEHLVDLEKAGWSDKSRLEQTTRFALIPKAETTLPPIVVNIPDGAEPIFKTRVKVATPMGDTTGRRPARIRLYGIGYKTDQHEYVLWVLPTGAIEVGPDSALSDSYLRMLTFTGSDDDAK